MAMAFKFFHAAIQMRILLEAESGGGGFALQMRMVNQDGREVRVSSVNSRAILRGE